MQQSIMWWIAVGAAVVWTVLTLHHLSYLIDANRANPAVGVLMGRQLPQLLLVALFWLLILKPSLVPKMWSPTVAASALAVIAALGVRIQIRERPKILEGTDRVSQGGTMILSFLAVLAAAAVVDRVVVADFVARYPNPVPPIPRQVAWYAAAFFLVMLTTWVMRCWRFRSHIAAASAIGRGPVRLIMGILGLVVTVVLLVMTAFNYFGGSRTPIGTGRAWTFVAMLAFVGLASRSNVSGELRTLARIGSE